MKRPPPKPAARKKAGDKRPQKERVRAMCGRIADGLSLRAAAEIEGLGHSDFLALVAGDDELESLYRASLAAKSEARVSELSDQADKVMAVALRMGGAANAYVAAFGHKVRSVQWTAEKEAPKRYGAKLDLKHSGELGIKRIEVAVVDPGT